MSLLFNFLSASKVIGIGSIYQQSIKQAQYSLFPGPGGHPLCEGPIASVTGLIAQALAHSAHLIAVLDGGNSRDVRQLLGLARYERPALARWNRALKRFAGQGDGRW